MDDYKDVEAAERKLDKQHIKALESQVRRLGYTPVKPKKLKITTLKGNCYNPKEFNVKLVETLRKLNKER